MTWSKLSDDFTDDCWTLSDPAYRLHTDGIIWSNRKLLDCVLPKEDVPRFAKRPEAIQELLDSGYWSDRGDAYIIRHHAQYQRSREAVIKQQEANALNGAKGGRGKVKAREQAKDLQSSESSSKPLSESVNESTPESEPLSESPSKRDRTGQGFLQGSPEVDYPTDPMGVEWRQQIDAAGYKSVQDLMKAQPMTLVQAKKIWSKAFPGREVA